MAFTSTLSVSWTISGGGVQTTITLPVQVNANSPNGHIQVALSNGFTVLTPPANASAVVVVPPPGSVITKTLKGITGDTGVPLNTAASTGPLPFPPSPGTFGITANGIETVDVYWL